MVKRFWGLVFFIAGLALFSSAAQYGYANDLPLIEFPVKPLAPAMQLQEYDGKAFNLETYRGRVVVVNFWATWCGPCKLEMPHLDKMDRELEEKGFEVISISTDDARASSKVKPLVKRSSCNAATTTSSTEAEPATAPIIIAATTAAAAHHRRRILCKAAITAAISPAMRRRRGCRHQYHSITRVAAAPHLLLLPAPPPPLLLLPAPPLPLLLLPAPPPPLPMTSHGGSSRGRIKDHRWSGGAPGALAP